MDIFISLVLALTYMFVLLYINRRASRVTAEVISEEFIARMMAKQEEIREALSQVVEEHTRGFEEDKNLAIAKQQALMDAQVEQARKKVQGIITYFKDTMESDETRRVLASAYEVAAQNWPNRGKADLELREAVLAHERAGAPYMENKPDKLPGGSVLN